MKESHQIEDREEVKEETKLTCVPLPPALHRRFSEQCFAISLCSSSTELAVLAACQLTINRRVGTTHLAASLQRPAAAVVVP